ncbi:MAG: site-specific integrase [Candidatus Omnitrophota bacterium]
MKCLTPHALRHTVGTRLLRKYKNAKLVQRYLGHSDVITTLKYYIDVYPPCFVAGVSGRFRGSGRDAGGKVRDIICLMKKQNT